MKRFLKWIIPLAVILLFAAGGAVYCAVYYHADGTALNALVSDGAVRISATDYGWFFDGPSEENALIFYPGGKVEETAYAPLAHRLAAAGMDVCLVKMPLRLAVLQTGKADAALRDHDYPNWYIGGHSLGGMCAAEYAAKHADRFRGVLLLGAYPIRQLPENLAVLSLYGTEDGVLRMETYEKRKQFFPENAAEIVIPGGNHAMFGSYGPQRGDGEARITAEAQWDETVRQTVLFFGLKPAKAA